jgi:SAM-dependent methyltransferase
MQPSNDLTWTGERFIPSVTGETALEHLHRYALALNLAPGKRVLDIACGEGYGSHLLAGKATSVVGIDLDAEAVAHACIKYNLTNLEFRQGDCTDLPLAAGSIDLVVSFETLEHHAEHDAMLAELRRVLTPDGVLLISTPDRLRYSDERNYVNHFHVRELYTDQFRQLILSHFPHAAFYGQRTVYASVTAAFDCTSHFVSYAGDSSGVLADPGLAEPLYLIAVASAGALPTLPASLFDGTNAWQGERQALLEELARTKDQLARTKLQLVSVYASIYWRLTYPLRLLRKGVKKLFGT